MKHLRPWTEEPRFLYYSGLATYEKSFELPSAYSARGASVVLNFGPGMPEEVPSPPGEHSMRAYLESPVREAAQVYVNRQLAGNIWRPPFQVDITRYVKPGNNELRVVVGNTAINEMAGKSQPDYRLLWARYGIRFIPQDMKNLQPLPSGIRGPVTLVETLPGQHGK